MILRRRIVARAGQAYPKSSWLSLLTISHDDDRTRSTKPDIANYEVFLPHHHRLLTPLHLEHITSNPRSFLFILDSGKVRPV